ncbi:hypothetical protein KP003_07125 [Geomonas nitrogeniifigens]|uniref:YbbR-like domain-containing protein n=1 Tax=Geomonas diazotrophica TaxID=2843197 RepID=A0ABX8JMN0_9BACT|nr:hypothetical protein [Geomonas nitrogeniifigens]QWV98998.1 hypothetical protein KP005_06875 [Geomonas nitrogeniifigens]QXE88164.1 hypothetical protein KP003_07125 [Geomonas nitrogeniifigens]
MTAHVKGREWLKGVKVLSVLLSVLIWLSVILERPGEMLLVLPVNLHRMPAGLKLDGAAPAEVEVVVAGPRILLFLLPFHQTRCDIDLAGAQPGLQQVSLKEAEFNLDPEIKVVHVAPATASFVLAAREK